MGNIGEISILGGGPAGLSTGYYAKKMGVPFKIYEANQGVGGFGITHKVGEFLFDMGAHRFHDKDPEVTQEVMQLLGLDLQQIEVPSKIYDNGRLVNFPLSPLDLIFSLGLGFFTKAGFSLLQGRFHNNANSRQHFGYYAEKTYGRVIAERFLLNYSEKLWGYPCDELSPTISGKRLKGLNLRTFFIEAILGSRKNAQHLDGAFYYPKYGFGMITDALADYCGREQLCVNTKITKVYHEDGYITSLELNHEDIVDVNYVISTLPITLLLNMMEPEPPKDILLLTEELAYRSLILVVLFIDKATITPFGTVYFPSNNFPFTRISEPRNRSAEMSPHGKTSLLVEIPCNQQDELWEFSDDQIVEKIEGYLIDIGWFKAQDLIGSSIQRISYAYPILTFGYETIIDSISRYLDTFKNLKYLGRNGQYAFSSFHHQLRDGMRTILEIKDTLN